MVKFAQIALIILCSPALYAHPVTFTDGVAFSSIYRPNIAILHGNYTLSRHVAIGATYLQLSDSDNEIRAGVGQVNVLAYRWNGMGSQANVYMMGGAGYGAFSRDDPAPAYYAALQLDYETPRFYSAMMGRTITDGNAYPYQAIARLGLAPFEAEYNALQAWLIGQMSYFPAMQDDPDFTVLLRFFYRTVLWEMGADLYGRPWLQLMVHY
ncbi:MAG: hypothetical protein VX589_07380 [Myxococcota bacterium]|nr:hypothetical protein [Myxococcota bacterium]